MSKQDPNEFWQELKDTWNNSSEGEKINIQMSSLILELESKVSQFEKDAIKRDWSKMETSWNKTKSNISQFEKDAISKDISQIKSSVGQFEKKAIKSDLTFISKAISKFLQILIKKK